MKPSAYFRSIISLQKSGQLLNRMRGESLKTLVPSQMSHWSLCVHGEAALVLPSKEVQTHAGFHEYDS